LRRRAFQLRHGRVDKSQRRVVAEALGEPQEGLLEVVVALGRDVVVLQGLLAVKRDHLGLDLALDAVDLVADEDDGDVVADADNVAVPVRDVLVGVAAGDVEHDDGALALDVVAEMIAQIEAATAIAAAEPLPPGDGDD